MTKGPFEQTFRRRFKKATMAALAPNPRQLGAARKVGSFAMLAAMRRASRSRTRIYYFF